MLWDFARVLDGRMGYIEKDEYMLCIEKCEYRGDILKKTNMRGK